LQQQLTGQQQEKESLVSLFCHGVTWHSWSSCLYHCVLSFIHSICADANGQHTGCRNVNDEDEGEEEEDDDNTTNKVHSKNVLPESANGNGFIFSMGEKAKVCVSLKNCKFLIEKVRSFIYQSPVEG
jgi:hypothetical protein